MSTGDLLYGLGDIIGIACVIAFLVWGLKK